MIKTAVVILNYNGEKLLNQFLPSVIHHTSEATLIVVDNASTDRSISLLEEKFPQVKLIKLDKNYGFCGGYNRALKEINADYYVLLNSDIEVTPGWLPHLTTLLDNDQTIAAVQPKILSYHQKNKFEYAGAAGGYIDSFGYPFCRGRVFDHIEEDLGQYDDERPVFWATGACLLIRAHSFHTFGGFDEDFFAHMEEIDLCWKINRSGKKIYYSGKSKVYHVGAGTLSYESPRKTYLNFRNALTLIFKHFNTGELICKLPLRMALDWVAAVVFLLKGQYKNALAVLEAHQSFISNYTINLEKRKALHAVYPQYTKACIHRGLIIADYHLLRRQTFNNPK